MTLLIIQPRFLFFSLMQFSLRISSLMKFVVIDLFDLDNATTQASELLLSLLSNPDIQLKTQSKNQLTRNPIQETQKNEWNRVQPPLKPTNTNQNSFLTNQMLNLQAALLTLSPTALNLLVSTLNNVQSTTTTAPASISPTHVNDINSNCSSSIFPEMRQTMLKNSHKHNQENSTSSLLSTVVNVLSGGNENNLAAFFSNTTSLTALAAKLDSAQSHQSGKAFMQRSQQNMCDMPRECNHNSSLSSNANNNLTMRNPNSRQMLYGSYQRRQSDDVPKMVGPFCQYISNVEGDIDRAATIYRNSASKYSCIAFYYVASNVTCAINYILPWL